MTRKMIGFLGSEIYLKKVKWNLNRNLISGKESSYEDENIRHYKEIQR